MKVKYSNCIGLFLMILTALLFVSCNDDEAKQVTLEVSNTTDWIGDPKDFDAREEAMKVKYVGSENWIKLPLDAISGFNYHRGTYYVIRVYQYDLPTPTYYGFNKRFELIKIEAQNEVTMQ